MKAINDFSNIYEAMTAIDHAIDANGPETGITFVQLRKHYGIAITPEAQRASALIMMKAYAQVKRLIHAEALKGTRFEASEIYRNEVIA